MSERARTSPDPPAGDADAELARLRAAIDAVDRALLARLNERAALVQAVGRLKSATAVPVYSAAREREIVERLAAENAGPFPAAGIAPVFREVISATRSLERALSVAFLGPAGTFSHQAVRAQFGALATPVPAASLDDVFARVERGEADFGVVPVENTTEGVVTRTLDALAETSLTLCGELRLRISHDLLSRSGERAAVRRVVSHPQPLAQCRQWLDRELPGVPREETASTAAAAEIAAADPEAAAVAGAIAAETYGLAVVARAIEDRRDNTTRFLVVGRTPPAPSGRDRTSVVFTVRKDRSGTLHGLLEPFARHAVNLSAIQARPLKGQAWEYLFFLDLEGHRSEPAVAKALAEAAGRALSHRVLGSYPRAAAAPGEEER